jgi:hypothetical protein
LIPVAKELKSLKPISQQAVAKFLPVADKESHPQLPIDLSLPDIVVRPKM